MSKLDIANEMKAFDYKDRNYYKDLEEVDAKKFAPYVLMRWGASVEGDPDIQEWYLRATNERVNINFFDVSGTKHKDLQWLLCTTASPGMGTFRHYWVAPKKESKVAGPTLKLLRKLFPMAKLDELELLAEINDLKDIKKYAALHGMDDQDIKAAQK